MTRVNKIDMESGVDLRGTGGARQQAQSLTITTSQTLSGALNEGLYYVWSEEDCNIAVDNDAGFTTTPMTYGSEWPIAGSGTIEKEGAIWVDAGNKIGVIGSSSSPGTASFYFFQVW